MKTTKYSVFIVSLLAVLAATGAESDAKTKTLKTFTAADPTISKDVSVTKDKAWLAEGKKARIVRLFEFANPDVEQCVVTYRAKLKTENLREPAYLEMWCRFPGKGEFFSRGLDNPIAGSNDWATFETPFFLKKGEKPDLIKLNLVLKGAGKIWVKDIELLTSPLPSER